MKLIAVLGLASLCACTHTITSSEPVERHPQSGLHSIAVANVAYNEKISLRVGTTLEAAPLKGCVLYLEGLADSIRNHDPLFSKLSENGYRVIAYDYLGQGGSSGSMNSTRLGGHSPHSIGTQARWLWDWYSKQPEGAACLASKKLVIGWSTGGLAAYKLAHEKWADAVVLISPGINPRIIVGEGLSHPLKAITLESLTRNSKAIASVQVDPLYPTTPLKVPLFGVSLINTGKLSQFWKIDPKIPGLVFVGTDDHYIFSDLVAETVHRNARHFEVKTYPGGRHELDSELPEVANDLQDSTVKFFDEVTSK